MTNVGNRSISFDFQLRYDNHSETQDSIEIVALHSNYILLQIRQRYQQEVLDAKNDLKTWLAWERERLNIYKSGQRWDVLQQRVADYDELPDDFYFWAKQQQVDALLILKQGQQARQILQGLIWSEKEIKIQKQWLPLWQQRVIKSYLVDNETSDALLAAQRYYQYYSSNNIEDRLLRARILLINEREDEVVELLKKDTKHPEGGMLYLLAQLRSKERPPERRNEESTLFQPTSRGHSVVSDVADVVGTRGHSRCSCVLGSRSSRNIGPTPCRRKPNRGPSPQGLRREYTRVPRH